MLIPVKPALADHPAHRWSSPGSPSALPRQTRVVVRFRDDVDVPCDDDGIEADAWLRENRRAPWRNVVGSSARRLRRLHRDIDPARLDEINDRLSSTAKRPIARLRRWFELDAEDLAGARALAAALRGQADLVVGAYVSCIGPPPMPPGDASAGTQAYRSSAPLGIGAVDVHGVVAGADGRNQHAIDVEMGWHLNHPDVGMAGKALLIGKEIAKEQEHGTAVLGILRGRGISCFGIAPGCDVDVASQIRIPNGVKIVDRLEETILHAIEKCHPGDVLLLEAQTSVSIGGRDGIYAPVEAEDGVFDAIRAAVDAGIVVVEAGGNGATDPSGVNDNSGIDLDTWVSGNGTAMLDRGPRDSGAILVSAAYSAQADLTQRDRLAYAPAGDRIDCFAWGDSIGTCRAHDAVASTYYPSTIQGFKGTSGAAAIVAGAALSVQGMVEAHHGRRLDPAQMRSLLSDPNLNTVLVVGGVRVPIGAMPDLAAIAAKVPGLAPNL